MLLKILYFKNKKQPCILRQVKREIRRVEGRLCAERPAGREVGELCAPGCGFQRTQQSRSQYAVTLDGPSPQGPSLAHNRGSPSLMGRPGPSFRLQDPGRCQHKVTPGRQVAVRTHSGREVGQKVQELSVPPRMSDGGINRHIYLLQPVVPEPERVVGPKCPAISGRSGSGPRPGCGASPLTLRAWLRLAVPPGTERLVSRHWKAHASATFPHTRRSPTPSQAFAAFKLTLHLHRVPT